MNRFAYESLCEKILKKTEMFLDVLSRDGVLSQEFQTDWKEFFLKMQYDFQSYGNLREVSDNCLTCLLYGREHETELSEFKDKLKLSLASFLENLFRESEHLSNDELGFSIIVQNEGRYLPEWIEYHKLIGVSRFFIYNNESSDNTEEILKPYIADGTVTYFNWPGRTQQQITYDHVINNFQFEVRLMGFLDADEFLLPLGEKSAIETLDEIMEKNDYSGGVGINWRLFGSSGLEKEPEGLVIQNYTKCSVPDFQKNQYVKLICDPRKILYPTTPHFFRYKESCFSVNENGERLDNFYNNPGPDGCKKLQVNHYYTKSKEFWEKKKMKGGDAFFPWNTRDWGDFIKYDRNEMEDTRILKYVESVGKALRDKGF